MINSIIACAVTRAVLIVATAGSAYDDVRFAACQSVDGVPTLYDVAWDRLFVLHFCISLCRWCVRGLWFCLGLIC